MQLTGSQRAAVAELLAATPLVLDGLDVRLGSYADPQLRGFVWLTLRDHWAVEHYRIDRTGGVTRPWAGGCEAGCVVALVGPGAAA